MYILFYILPIFIVGDYFTNKVGVQFIGAWMFGGIIIIAAIAGYLSHGITIWEPAVAGAGLVIAFFETPFNNCLAASSPSAVIAAVPEENVGKI